MKVMRKREMRFPDGAVRYWVSAERQTGDSWLVFLPGLTADHRLFGAQIAPSARVVGTHVEMTTSWVQVPAQVLRLRK